MAFSLSQRLRTTRELLGLPPAPPTPPVPKASSAATADFQTLTQRDKLQLAAELIQSLLPEI